MNQDKINKLEGIFSNAKDIIAKALSPDPEGETTNECFVLLKDLAHCGGEKRSAPISIMRAGTIFRKRKEDNYFTDGFHVIARSVANHSEDYFLYLTEEEGNGL